MYFLFDIGGTNMRAAVSDGVTILRKKYVPTPQNYLEGISRLHELSRELSHGGTYKAAAGGIAGMFSPEKDSLLLSPNLVDWVGKAIKNKLTKELGVTTTLANDTALAGLGEAFYGAGKGYKIVMYLGIGTGVGGARIINQRIDDHVYGFEPGHMIISSSHEDGTLEDFVSGGGIVKRKGTQPQKIDDPLFWEEVTEYLAIGIYNSILHWSPHIVVLGGGIIEEGKIELTRLSQSLTRRMPFMPKIPLLAKAAFPDESALLGAQYILRTGN